MSAVGKTNVARNVAKQFHLKLLAGGDILKQMAEEHGYHVGGDDWWDTPEGMKFLQERVKMDRFDREVDRRLVKAVEDGGVVVTSYPLPWLTMSGLKIWLAASLDDRAKRMMNRDTIPFEEAAKVVAKRDMENKQLYRKLYRIEFGEELSVFDLVVNTENLEASKVVEVICTFLESFVEKRGSLR